MESKRIDRSSWKAMDPQSKLQDDKVDKVHIYLIIPLEPQHSVKAPNVSRISLTAGHRAAAIIRNRIPLILRFYLRRKIGGPADRATDRPPTSSLPLSLPSVPPPCRFAMPSRHWPSPPRWWRYRGYELRINTTPRYGPIGTRK